MAKFAYKAKRSPTEITEGAMEAGSENAVINKLNQLGYHPVWIMEESVSAAKARILRIKSKDLADFTRRVSELLESGLTLYNALSVVESQSGSCNLKTIICCIEDSLKEGKCFSAALKRYPGVFSELYVNVIRSGEESGSMNETLAGMADFLDKTEDMRSKIIAALAYPGLTAIIGFMTIVILIVFIIPRLVNMFIEMGEELPLATRALIWISDFARAYWIFSAFFAVCAIFLFKRVKLNPIARNKIDKIRLKIPILGNIAKNSEFMRFSKTLSMLLKNGVPMLNSLKIASSVVANNAIKEDINFIHNDVKAGMSLAASIKKRECFPLYLANMVAVGEEGGFLDKALLNISRNYEIELDRAMKIITALMEPVFILIMGMVIGFIVVAMLLPVFQISLVAH